MGSESPSFERDLLVESMFEDLGAAVIAYRSIPSDAAIATLHGDEGSLIENARPGRRREFATGRACARAALRELGTRDPVIRRRQDRSPVWPGGTVGSITHTDGSCIAVAGESSGDWHPGVDIEISGRVTPDVARIALTEREQEWIAASEAADVVRTAVFAAKEALYKAQHPITGAWVGFDDVEAIEEPENGFFRLLPCGPHPALDRLDGPIRARWAQSAQVGGIEHVIAAVIARPRPGRPGHVDSTQAMPIP